MKSRLAVPDGAWNLGPLHLAQAGAGRFMITLCTLAAPVFIRPPQSPQLRPFRFFMSQARQSDGSERLYLHMGYFDTLADAEKWAESVRRHYPRAFATLAPDVLSRPANSEAPSLPHDASYAVVPQRRDPAPVNDESLTDTQVLKILGARRVPIIHDDVDETKLDQIELLRADDTSTRRILKEAVVRGAPVSFAVQLRWSAQPIDLSHVRVLPIFKTHTLYATESRRHGRSRYFLRLGFFGDPISAKQVAVQVRWTYDSAAVVPVVEPEITRAREAGRGASGIPYLAAQEVGPLSDSAGAPGSPASSESLNAAPGRVLESVETFKQRLEPRAEREMWDEPDSLSESGVRHLRVEVQEHLSGRWRTIRLSERPSNEPEFHS
jgi:hypothetical protein